MLRYNLNSYADSKLLVYFIYNKSNLLTSFINLQKGFIDGCTYWFLLGDVLSILSARWQALQQTTKQRQRATL
ncbi:MAG: hypothetical protein CFE24_13085 [Flavobacterium sp. BFFFF2]|nr:MAG: hypothetical protein CFE24_13085 [Flavobacterium sp. BFFFF2]